MNTRTFLTAALAAAPACAAAAAAAADDVASFETIVVTPTRSEMPLADTLAPITVIDRETISQSQTNDLAELLQFQAGLDLGRNGGPGQLSSIFIRGAESNHTLVLVDGVRINPGTIGAAAIQNIDPEWVERIEIVKGPRSALYGSEAIGGVINVITRRGAAASVFEAAAGGGANATREASLRAGLSGARGEIDVGVGYRETAGFPTLVGDDIDRGSDILSVNLSAGTDLEFARVDLRHWQAEGTTEYSDFFATPIDQDYANRSTALSVSNEFAGGWRSALTVSRIVDDIDQNQSPDFARTRRDTWDWQNTFRWKPGHQLSGGVNFWNEQADALVFGGVTDSATEALAVYLQSLQRIGRHDLQVSARFSDHEAFGNHTTWHLGYGFKLGERGQLTFNAGSGFRAPDASERFGFGGNPDLDPEVSRSFELGYRQGFGSSQQLQVQLFDNRIEDLVVFDFDLVAFSGVNRNIDETRIRGVELSYALNAGPWNLQAAATVQDPKNEKTDARLPRRSRQAASATLSYDLGVARLGLNLLASGERKDSDFSAIVNAGYVLANLTATWDIGAGLQLTGRVENLLDTEYSTAAGFNSADRGVYVGVRYKRQ